jgi:predicted amidohydrolase YtcJ
VVGADQALTVEEAVRASTFDAAASYFADDALGSLEVGKLADIVVLDGDIFATPRERISDLGVATTILAGNVVFAVDR